MDAAKSRISRQARREERQCAALADRFIPESWIDQVKISQQDEEQ
jgi:hypothetical protein